MGRPAAKKGDLCLHAGMVTTGSPDTTTCDKASARIGDQHSCLSHPPGNPPAGPGPIVSASRTVFINRQRAARIGDTLACGSGGMAPPGTANPQVQTYRVRQQDSYHNLMRHEHEVAARDRVGDMAEPDRGKGSVVLESQGVGTAEAPRSEAVTTTVASGQGVAYPGAKGRANPHAGGPASGDVPVTMVTRDTPVSDAGDAAAIGVNGSKYEGPERAAEGHRLRLRFSMDLAVGGRRGSRGGGGGIDKIVAPFCTVIVGG